MFYMVDKAAIIREAQKYLAKGQLERAIAEWEKLLQASPEANTHNVVGDLYLKKGEKAKAVEHFHKAAKMFRDEGFTLKALAIYKKILNAAPADAPALYALGELNEEKNIYTDAIKYYLAAADQFVKANQKTEAVRTYERIVSLAPKNLSLRLKIAELFSREGFVEETAREYVEIAGLYEAEGNHQEARSYLERALEIKPSSREALLSLSRLCEAQGDTEEAIRCLQTALERLGRDRQVLLPLIGLLMRTERYQEALGLVQELLEAEPEDLEARRLKAEAYYRLGRTQEAWQEYSEVLEELIFKERYDEAVAVLEAFKEAEPVEARRKLVALYKQKQEPQEALRELLELAEVLREQGLMQEALSCYTEAKGLAPEDETIKEHIAQVEEALGLKREEEKSTEEALNEAEIFLRYGLYDDARELLETLKVREPENIDVHLKLKELYSATSDVEQAVTECIVLRELYQRAGRQEEAQEVLREAYGLNPRDARLLERFGPPPEGLKGEAAEEAPASLADYEEELSEADFYLKQGLLQEAEAIYRRLAGLMPQEALLQERLKEVQAQKAAEEEAARKEPAPAEEEPLESISLQEVLSPEEVPAGAEPPLESDVMEIFEEFKKGLEKELEEEDTETRYNLGIAYKEMGLLDDAIREFQAAQHDPKLFVQSATMLGVCYSAKGLYSLAIEALQSALMKMKERDEAYWGVKYDLAEAYERAGQLREAFDLYTEVYGYNAKFRAVAEKINALRPQVQASERARKSRVSYI
jgi:tetratricopeptide (TPR) repeat protein